MKLKCWLCGADLPPNDAVRYWFDDEALCRECGADAWGAINEVDGVTEVILTKNCAQCRKEFTTDVPSQKYCGRECARPARAWGPLRLARPRPSTTARSRCGRRRCASRRATMCRVRCSSCGGQYRS